MDEIQALIPSFRAAVMQEITKHRQTNGDLNTVDQFVAAVGQHRTRYSQKLEAIRLREGDAATSEQADAAEKQIAIITDGEIARVRAAGVVEFA